MVSGRGLLSVSGRKIETIPPSRDIVPSITTGSQEYVYWPWKFIDLRFTSAKWQKTVNEKESAQITQWFNLLDETSSDKGG